MASEEKRRVQAKKSSNEESSAPVPVRSTAALCPLRRPRAARRGGGDVTRRVRGLEEGLSCAGRAERRRDALEMAGKGRRVFVSR